MKFFKQVIIYLSILSIITVAIFATSPFKSYAEVPASQKAISHDGGWPAYQFTYTSLNKYFTIDDATGIPDSSSSQAYYFYTDDGISFYALEGKKLYTLVLNRGVGVGVGTQYLGVLYNNFLQCIDLLDSNHNIYIQSGLYDSNNNFLGYCVNDISGCYYYQPEPVDTPAVDVPDYLVKDVRNHFDYYTDNDDSVPDYFTFRVPSTEFINNNWVQPNTNLQERENNFKNNYFDLLEIYNICSDWKIMFNNSTGQREYTNWGNNTPGLYFPDNNAILIGSSSNWVTFCQYNELNKENNELLFSDFLTRRTDLGGSNQEMSLTYFPYNRGTGELSYFYGFNLSGTDVPNLTPIVTNQQGRKLGNSDMDSGRYTFNIITGKDVTIYKDWNSFKNINIDKQYEPDSYKSSIYYNYNSEDDHSFTINYTYIDNSETNNETIYNEGTDIFYDEVEKGEPSIGTPPIEITIIIENIIPEPSEDPDPDPEPNPDEPNLEDDTVLDAILKALKRFFDVIGKLLGTVLAGLLEMIDAILESIAGIMENLTGVTDFLGALFSWLPDPIPQVLGIGVSLCILCAVINFIRG